MVRVAAALEPRGVIGIQRNHQRTGRRDHRSQRLLVELAAGAAGVVSEVVFGLAPHLGLPRSDKVHGACYGAHEPAGLGHRHMQHLAEAQRRVHGRRDCKQEPGPVSRAALLRQGLLELAGRCAQPHHGHCQQNQCQHKKP